jgi:uncharacterized membrane protein YccF (DUF307 family)
MRTATMLVVAWAIWVGWWLAMQHLYPDWTMAAFLDLVKLR